MAKRKKNEVKYSGLVIILSLFLFGIIIARVCYLSLSNEVDGYNLKKLGQSRTTKTDTIYATRGSIYSSSGDLLAQNVTSYKLIAYLDPKRTTKPNNPQHVVDKEGTAKALAPIIGLDEKTILKYLSKENVYQVEFGTKGKNLNEITKNKIEDLNLPGIDFIESYRRYYPKGDFASYTIGYAVTDEGTTETKGEMGIEKYYDKVLSGENGSITYQKDVRGYRIADTKAITKEAVSGKDIYLTIDTSIQFFVEQAIENQSKKWKWDWMQITIMDAKTGAILAATTDPSFDLNKKDMTNYLDYMVSSPYEPGSTMKTFTYMATMEQGKYDGNETYMSGHYTAKDGTVINDWRPEGWGRITFDRGYALSSNVAVMNLMKRKLNASILRSYYKKLGFGRKTGITLPNEQTGKLNFQYETEILNATFGQGITTTPIQNVKALTPLTNDGILLKPYIVSKIVDSETKEVILENKRTEIERVASTKTVQKIISLMDDCVNGTNNTGIGFKMKSKELIGKTGTAQIADTKHGGYLDGTHNVIVSFSGLYPKKDPKVIIYASVKKPTNGAQKPLSNAIKEIVNNLARYYGEESDTDTKVETSYTIPNITNKKTDYAKTILKNNKINYTIIGKGNKITHQIPQPNTPITSKEKVFLITNDSNMKVPDVTGLSGSNAKEILENIGLNVKIEGVGYVKSQSIKKNSTYKKGETITIKLKNNF